jgi:Putative zinc dependent peptidase (DUF5700)
MHLRNATAISVVVLIALTCQADSRIDLRIDTSEAEAVLAILSKQRVGTTVNDADWQRLFNCEPYVRLKKREAAMQRNFTDDDFKKFVISPELASREAELRRTLAEWAKADLEKSAQRVLGYLPAEAKIRAKVYPVIKPRPNSFVFEVDTDPAIFLYLDPAVTPQQFENTVAHELHHIGFASFKSAEPSADTPEPVRDALGWMSAFGEGCAMLAAAGGPDVHPHANSKPEDRVRWDRDSANFNQDLKTLERFFLDVIEGRFPSKEEERKKAFSFFGTQGPWYTVGYKMAVTIERSKGRAALIDAMTDPRRMLALYSRTASENNRHVKNEEKLAIWSPELLEKIDVHGPAKRQMR